MYRIYGMQHIGERVVECHSFEVVTAIRVAWLDRTEIYFYFFVYTYSDLDLPATT